MQITIDMDTKPVTNALIRFTEQIETEAGKESYNALDSARRTLKVYPPEIPGQLYKRTGRLGRSWVVGTYAPHKWTISNDARAPRGGRTRYAVYVHGDSRGERQAPVHSALNPKRLRPWPIARQIIMREKAKAVARLSRYISVIARRVGL
jgi:hypothetical protein